MCDEYGIYITINSIPAHMIYSGTQHYYTYNSAEISTNRTIKKLLFSLLNSKGTYLLLSKICNLKKQS